MTTRRLLEILEKKGCVRVKIVHTLVRRFNVHIMFIIYANTREKILRGNT